METKFRDRNAHRCDRFMKKDETTYEQMCAKIRPAVKGKQVLELAAGRRFFLPYEGSFDVIILVNALHITPWRKSEKPPILFGNTSSLPVGPTVTAATNESKRSRSSS